MLTCFYPALKGTGTERRDELGNTAPYRSHPHLGEDEGYKGNSAGKPIYAVHDAIVTAVTNNTQLGWTTIYQIDSSECGCKWDGYHIENNHEIEKPTVKIGQKVKHYTEVIGKIGASGTALSGSGANHLHYSMAKVPVPHTAPLEHKISIWKLQDESAKNRAALRKASK